MASAFKQHETVTLKLYFNIKFTQRLETFYRENADTLFLFMASVLIALIHRVMGNNDIVKGVADKDCGFSKFDHLIGFTVNILRSFHICPTLTSLETTGRLAKRLMNIA